MTVETSYSTNLYKIRGTILTLEVTQCQEWSFPIGAPL